MQTVLSGSLKFFSLPEVLTFLSGSRKNAKLVVTDGASRTSIYLHDGALTFASSDQEQFSPGLLLFRKKKIDRTQKEKLDQIVQREGDLYPLAASKQNLFPPDQLLDFVKTQTSEVIFDALRREEGSFTVVEEGQRVVPVALGLELPALIAEGQMRAEEWSRCLTLLPDSKALFQVVSDPSAQGKITLTLEQWRVLFKLNGRDSLEQIVREAEEEPIEVYRIVYELLSNGLVREVEQDTSTATTKDSPLPPQPAAEPIAAAASHVAPHLEIETMPPPPPAWEPPPPPAATIGGVEAAFDDRPSVSQQAATIVEPSAAHISIACLMVDGTERTAFPLVDREYVIGREAGNSIQIPDSSVSATHARVTLEDGSYVIEDLRSRNGTYVNGERIGRQALHENDKVRLGKVLLTFTRIEDLKTIAPVPPRV